MSRILYVDDDETNCHLVEKILELDGYEIFIADNGMVGLDLMHRYQMDLVILDYQMPEMDGLEVLQRLRAIDAYVTTPVLMLTADYYVKQLILESGATEYMLKPIRRKILLQTVKQLLKKTSSE